MPKAANLAQVLNYFDPEGTLTTPQELTEWYVPRADSPREAMATLLQAVQKPQKLLFTGHRGCGKSTELAKLAQQLQEQFFVVLFSVKDITDIGDIDYADVVLGVAFEIFRQATDPQNKVKVKKALLKEVYAWFQQVTGEEKKKVAEIGAKLNLDVVSLEGKYRTEATTRQSVRQKSQGRLSELQGLLGYLVEDVEQKIGRRVLVMVDDLDKIDLQRAHDVFYLYSSTLTAPRCSIIYTFPIALRNDNDFVQMKQYYTEVFGPLPNFPICRRDGTPDPQGLASLERVITNRARPDLFTPEARKGLVQASGGLPFELVSLARRAATYALVAGASQIDQSTVQRAVLERRIEYQILLGPEQLERLAAVHRTKAVKNDAEHRLLLHTLSVLEYRNGQGVWYDVHPVVQPLLPGSPGP